MNESEKPEYTKDPKKDKNSSITRVRPILGQLLQSVEGGRDRLASLINLAPHPDHLPEELRRDPGEILTWCRRKRWSKERGYPEFELPGAFEALVPPSGAFLRWLIENPENLHGDPDSSNDARVRTQRKALKGEAGPEERLRAQREALRSLDAVGADGSDRQWWAFEGFSSVDCLIETERLILFIEGKRKDTVSETITWYSPRNQVARNLECARQMALLGDKDFAVLVIGEQDDKKEAELEQSISRENLSRSFPHLPEDETAELLDRLLGSVTWQQVLQEWPLDEDDYTPETVEVAVDRFFSPE